MAGVIEHVHDNKDKQATYTYQIGRYRKALKEEFYLEAMMIVYSMMEDRLRALLFYAGVFDDRNSLKVSNKTKSDLKSILSSKYGEGKQFSLTTIKGKMELIYSIMEWVGAANTSENEYDQYQMALKSLMESTDLEQLKDVLDQISQWVKYRNDIMHASMNKNIDAMYSGMREKVEMGMEYARILDAHVKDLKKCNIVRKKMKMQLR